MTFEITTQQFETKNRVIIVMYSMLFVILEELCSKTTIKVLEHASEKDVIAQQDRLGK